MQPPIDQVPAPDEQLLPQSPNELEVNHHLPTLHRGQPGPEPAAEISRTKLAVESIESVRFEDSITAMVPAIYPTFVIAPVPAWPWPPNLASSSTIGGAVTAEPHEIVRPTPLFPKELPAHVDEVVSMSKLSIADGSRRETTDLSLELMGSTASSPRQSAFHANTSIAVPVLNKNNKSPIHAV